MRRLSDWLIWFAALVGVLGSSAGPAPGGTDGEALRELGILGDWAANCRMPPAPANPYVTYRVSLQGEAYRRTRGGGPDAITIIRDVQTIANDRIRWTESPDRSLSYDVVTQRVGDRIRSVESTGSDGKAYAHDGVMTASGTSTPLLDKCPDGTFVLADAWMGCTQWSTDRNRVIAACTRVIGRVPDSALAYVRRGLAYGDRRDFESAIKDLSEAVRLDPNEAMIRTFRARLFLAAGKAAFGLPDIERALELQPDGADAIVSLDTRGQILEAVGRRTEAIADYRRILSLLPPGGYRVQKVNDALKRLGATP